MSVVGTVTVPAWPGWEESLAYARACDPAELQRHIAEQNTPERIAARRKRLDQYRANRLAAEAEYYAATGGRS